MGGRIMNMQRSMLLAAALAIAAPAAQADAGPARTDAWAGPKPRDWKISPETPGTFGQRVDRARAKAKAARQARKAQRMRAKGKR